MKKLLHVATLVLCFATVSNASGNDLPQAGGNGAFDQTVILTDLDLEMNGTRPKDCTINVEITLSDGTTITGEITITDISWWNCTKIQVANFLNRVF